MTTTVTKTNKLRELQVKTIEAQMLRETTEYMSTTLKAEWDKRTKEANALFSKMSPPERRVAIAKDVLLQLKSKRYKATSGIYIDFKNPLIEYDNVADLSDAPLCALSEGVKCDVCARGAMFMSACGLFDKLTASDMNMDADYSSTLDGFDSEFQKYESRFFSRAQLALIEAAFEGNDVQDKLSAKEEEAARKWYKAHKGGAAVRLKAIMNNIIRNKGTFVLPKR